MKHRNRAARPAPSTDHWRVIALVAATALGCASGDVHSPAIQAFLDGPEGWLVLPAERRELATLSSRAEVALWSEAFWARRDPDPEATSNLRQETFERRVRDADRLYEERGGRGALSDRGRALILLGPPTVLRRGPRASPRWAPRADGARTRPVVSEEWVYPPQRLPAIVATWLAERGDTELTLRFFDEGGRLELIEGEPALELAAEGWVVDPTIKPSWPHPRRSAPARSGGRSPAPKR